MTAEAKATIKSFLSDGSRIQRSATDLTSGSDDHRFSGTRGTEVPICDTRAMLHLNPTIPPSLSHPHSSATPRTVLYSVGEIFCSEVSSYTSVSRGLLTLLTVACLFQNVSSAMNNVEIKGQTVLKLWKSALMKNIVEREQNHNIQSMSRPIIYNQR
jgi:hypothetical protein